MLIPVSHLKFYFLIFNVETIGLVAAFLTTMSFLPQVVQAWRTRSVEDISLTMYVMFTLGLAMWLIYGIMIENLPIIISNMITLTFASSILFLKLKSKLKK